MDELVEDIVDALESELEKRGKSHVGPAGLITK